MPELSDPFTSHVKNASAGVDPPRAAALASHKRPMLLPYHFVAQSSDVASVVFYSLLLIGLIIGAFYVIARLRRWLKEEDAPSASGFTLSDLRELHRRGAMTTEEFEKAKANMLDAAQKMAAKLPHPLARSDKAVPGGAKPPSEDDPRKRYL